MAATVKHSSNPTEPASGDSGQGQSEGRASRHRLRRQKPAVVREVTLARGVSGTTAAALLLADGSVWWVVDLSVGAWQPVTSAAAVSGAGKGFLPSSGVSAITVARLRRRSGDSHAGGNGTCGKGGPRRSVAGRDDGDDFCRPGDASTPLQRGEDILSTTGDGVTIIAGRDDGWLFLLTPSQCPLAAASSARSHELDEAMANQRDGDNRHAPIPGPWTVSAAWKGHRSRVTAIWVVGDVAAAPRSSLPITSKGAPSQAFIAALDSSRVEKASNSGGGKGDSGRFGGALVSAGADGTVAWWDWPRDGGSSTGDGGGGGKSSRETERRAAKLRMVSQVKAARSRIACKSREGVACLCFLSLVVGNGRRTPVLTKLRALLLLAVHRIQVSLFQSRWKVSHDCTNLWRRMSCSCLEWACLIGTASPGAWGIICSKFDGIFVVIHPRKFLLKLDTRVDVGDEEL